MWHSQHYFSQFTGLIINNITNLSELIITHNISLIIIPKNHIKFDV